MKITTLKKLWMLARGKYSVLTVFVRKYEEPVNIDFTISEIQKKLFIKVKKTIMFTICS